MEIIQLDIEDINQRIETLEAGLKLLMHYLKNSENVKINLNDNVKNSIHLPQNPLPEFSVVIAEFSNFKNQFINLISNNEQLNDSQKLYYLRASLKGEAKQILVDPNQRDLQRIMWKSSADALVKCYKLTTVTYETISAPFLGTRTLKALADEEKAGFPDAADMIYEIQRSTEILAKIAQLSEFKAEIDVLKKGKGVSKTSKLNSLDLFLDENSLLRVGGKLSNADLPFAAKHEIIIPTEKQVTARKKQCCIGILVILKENILPPSKWAMVRILQVIYGTDGKDEVEKLAYQLNEEAEWTERPTSRLSKVMYGSTCADMQVDVMGECLSSIKHVFGANNQSVRRHLDAFTRGRIIGKLEEGRSVTSVAAEFGIAHSIVSRLWRQFQTTGTAIRGFSSGGPRGTTPADDRYIVLQARRNRRQTAGEIARHTTQTTGRPISHFTVLRRLHGRGLFARRPVRCVPLTPAHRRRRSLWCREHRNWTDNEWGRVLFTDESTFSLSSDSHRILIWREREAAIIPRAPLKGTGSVNGTRYCNENLLPYGRLFRGAMGLQFLFMDDNPPCHRTVEAEQLLESEDIERMDWPAGSPDLNPIEHVWDFLGRRLAARTLPPVTIQELRLALQDEWAAMPQQLIDTFILSMGNLPSSQGRSYPLLKTGCFLLDTHHRDVSAFSRIALHATFSIKLLFIPLISLLKWVKTPKKLF
ncbi:transposable element Tcb2 transposase [Trichonephila clavipes]|nr:transposable element Tcb2 transposase [Trichonephila clavipes]